MTSRFLAGSLVTVAVAAFATTSPFLDRAIRAHAAAPGAQAPAPAPAASTRAPRNAEEFDQMFNQIKNWGRWGKDDELGAVNLITPAKRKQALGLAKLGTVISIAHNPLTEAAEKLKRYEFMLAITPIPVTGGTGFPVNALATF
jgi:hypothetical protein